MPTDFSKLIKAPAPELINPLCHAARLSTMEAAFGNPKPPTDPKCDKCGCNERASARVKKLQVTENVGPFRVTGVRPFVDVLRRVFARVKKGNPDLYTALGSDGVLCVRFQRKTQRLSNHAWGTAIDIKIKNPKSGKFELDLPVDNGLVQLGCSLLYDFFQQDGIETGEWCFWGAGFSREDGMHFEASDELIRRWKAEGKL